jgi:hypothetical protein
MSLRWAKWKMRLGVTLSIQDSFIDSVLSGCIDLRHKVVPACLMSFFIYILFFVMPE